MKVRTARPAVRRAAATTLLVSIGITIGSYARPGGPDAARAEPAGAAAPRPDTRRGPERAPDSAAASTVSPPEAVPEMSAVMRLARPEFGGTYAVLRGAETAGDAPHAQDPVPAAATSVIPPAPAIAADEPDHHPSISRESDAPPPGADASRSAAGFRPSPAQGIPRGVALRHPLLALARGGGRVAFHDLGVRGAPTPAGIEGEWAVIGRCDRAVRIDFALPVSRAGELRGIGRTESSPGWSVEPVVARQACSAAGERYTRPRLPTDTERERYRSIGEAFGYAPGDLVQLLELRGAALLVFRRRELGAALVAASTGAAPATTWSYRAEAADGDLSLVGVYRIGAGAEAWMALGNPGAPDALLITSSPDGRNWETPTRAMLREP